MSAGAGVSSRKLPPLAAGLVRTEVAIDDAPCRHSAACKFKQPFENSTHEILPIAAWFSQ
jgi:hypothetical protein